MIREHADLYIKQASSLDHREMPSSRVTTTAATIEDACAASVSHPSSHPPLPSMDKVVQLADRSLRSMMVMEQHLQITFGGLNNKSKSKIRGVGKNEARDGGNGRRKTEMELFMRDEYAKRLSLLLPKEERGVGDNNGGNDTDADGEHDDEEYYEYDYSDEEKLKKSNNKRYWMIHRRYRELSLKRRQEYAAIAGGGQQLVKGSNIRKCLADQVPTFFKNRTLQPIASSPNMPQSSSAAVAATLPIRPPNNTKYKEPLSSPIKRRRLNDVEEGICSSSSRGGSPAVINTSMEDTATQNKKNHKTISSSSSTETQRRKWQRQRANIWDCEVSNSNKRRQRKTLQSPPQRCISNTTAHIHGAIESTSEEGGTRQDDDEGDSSGKVVAINNDIVRVTNNGCNKLSCGSGGDDGSYSSSSLDHGTIPSSVLPSPTGSTRSFDDDNGETNNSSSSNSGKLLSETTIKQEEIVGKRERDHLDVHEISSNNADSTSPHPSVLSSASRSQNNIGVALPDVTSSAGIKQEGFVVKRERDELDNDSSSFYLDNSSSQSSMSSSSEVSSSLEDHDISQNSLSPPRVKNEGIAVKRERDELDGSYTSSNVDYLSPQLSVSLSSEGSSSVEDEIIEKL